MNDSNPAEQVKNNTHIADPKFKEALVQATAALDKVSHFGAESLAESVGRQTDSVQKGYSSGQIGREVAREMQSHPDAFREALPGLIGNADTAKKLQTALDKANGDLHESLQPKEVGFLQSIANLFPQGESPAQKKQRDADARVESDMYVKAQLGPQDTVLAEIRDAINANANMAIKADVPHTPPAAAAQTGGKHR